MTISSRVKAQMEKASWIRKMFEEGEALKRKLGADAVFDFSLGNPLLEPPPRFKEVLRDLVESDVRGAHRYMPNAGYPDVREEIAAFLTKERGQSFTAQQITMTCGAGGGLNVIFKAILDPGDEVIIFSPFFVEYLFYVDNHGGVIKVAPMTEDFLPDPDALRAAVTPRTKAVIINSPNNPTGRLYDRASLDGMAAVLEEANRDREHPIYLISDEPYLRIVFDGLEVPDVSDVYPHTLLVTSHSKDLSLPGERIGYVAVGADCAGAQALAGAMTFTNRILGFVNAPALMQRAAGRLQGVTVDPMEYQRKRDIIVPGLREAGYEVIHPEGAFYVFPKTPIEDDVEFTRILQEQHILIVPGSGFGCPGHFRLAYCVEDDMLVRALPGFRAAMEKCR